MANSYSSKILVVDDDHVIGELVRAILTDEGYAVSTLNDLRPEAVQATVNRMEPDGMLLDSGGNTDYGQSWEMAAWLQRRDRPVPVVMFTGHTAAVREAQEGTSERSQAAAFSAILQKPFELDELTEAVGQSVRAGTPFNETQEAEEGRTSALRARLEAAGATDIQTLTRREWATFRAPNDALVQLYWWQREGMYFVLRYRNGDPEAVGRFYDLDTAIEVAMA